MFIPGETISHRFIIPFSRDDIKIIEVSYRQNDHIVLVEPVYPGQVETITGGGQFTVTLTQEKSLLFKDDADYYVQLNVIFKSDARCASVEIKGNNKMQHIREVVN